MLLAAHMKSPSMPSMKFFDFFINNPQLFQTLTCWKLYWSGSTAYWQNKFPDCSRTSHHSAVTCRCSTLLLFSFISVRGWERGKSGSQTWIYELFPIVWSIRRLRLPAHPPMCVSISGPHWVTWPGDEGGRGGGNTCLTPLSNKEVMFQWRVTINLDTGTQALIDLIPRCPIFCEVAAKNTASPRHTLSMHPLPHWAQACSGLGPSSPGSKKIKIKGCTKAEVFWCTCCQICSLFMFGYNMRFFRTRSLLSRNIFEN